MNDGQIKVQRFLPDSHMQVGFRAWNVPIMRIVEDSDVLCKAITSYYAYSATGRCNIYAKRL